MLRGELVELCPLSRDHMDAYIRWMTDLEVTRYLNMHGVPITREAEEAWFDRMVADENAYTFGVHPLGAEAPIGNCGLGVDARHRSAMFGIVIGERDHWGKGFGTDATRTLVRFGFEELNLHRIELRVVEFNERGMAVYKKAGFSEEGRRRQAWWREGRWWDEVVMSVLEGEWRQAEPPDAAKKRTRRPGTKPGGSRRPRR